MQMQMARKQQGFTIIELVVVILLLGILAATALPRFLDVTEEAHESAFNGTFGGFSTGVALFRAQWVGTGQAPVGTQVGEFGNLRVAPGYNLGAYDAVDDEFDLATIGTAASGYPSGLASLTDFDDFTGAQCQNVFENVLQSGAPRTNVDGTFANADIDAFRDDISDLQADAATTADFQIYAVEMPIDSGVAIDPVPVASGAELNYEDILPACIYVYAAEAGNTNRSFVYVPWTGEITRYSNDTDLFTRLTDSGMPVVP